MSTLDRRFNRDGGSEANCRAKLQCPIEHRTNNTSHRGRRTLKDGDAKNESVSARAFTGRSKTAYLVWVNANMVPALPIKNAGKTNNQ